jgi:hypothetical protein
MNEPQLCWRSPTNPSLYKTRGGSTMPIQAAGWLSGYIKKHNCSFAFAFAAGTGPGGPIILID